MLLEASKVNPHAEIVGQDIDARCAKITAINLGLRGRYGWVVCGNSLSGEAKFAYRVGSFFHETPAGIRRGVIRDVLPEQSPIPMLAEGTRRDAGSLLGHEEKPETATVPTMLTIIEVPQWLARLEPKLAAIERGQSGHEQKSSEPSMPEPAGQPPKQQRLF